MTRTWVQYLSFGRLWHSWRSSFATAIRNERPATVISAKARNDANKGTLPKKTLARDPPWFVNQCSRERFLYGIHVRRLIEMRNCTQSDRASGRSQHHCIYIEADLERRKLGPQNGTTITKEVKGPLGSTRQPCSRAGRGNIFPQCWSNRVQGTCARGCSGPWPRICICQARGLLAVALCIVACSRALQAGVRGTQRYSAPISLRQCFLV